MPFARMTAVSSCLAACIAAVATVSAADAPRVQSEPSRTPATKSAQTWRAGELPAGTVSRLRYGEMSAQRILKLHEDNASRVGKPMRIGIAREASTESATRSLPAPQWVALRDGSSVARLEFVSPLAYGIRAGLRIEALDARAELRFSGSARPDVVVAAMRGEQVRSLAGDDGLFWTPTTEGETQVVEIWLPAGVPHARLDAPRLSHLMTNAIDDFKILKNIGSSGACNIDTVCRVAELGQRFVDAKAAVARMTFVKDGSSYFCTGTLLNDTDASTQIPYFHTANHCIGTAAVAATLNTYWNYESTTCNVDVPASYVLLSGGADHLYSSAVTDGALLRLRDTAPAGATFGGWDAGALASSTNVTAIHHPSGDLKKVSFGQHLPADSDGSHHAAGWLQGTTEGGSSGSGLFTSDASGYYLRGGLYGGYASCSNSGALSDPDNVDWYSRFDVDFPNISQYLAPVSTTPRRRNGSHPLAPP